MLTKSLRIVLVVIYTALLLNAAETASPINTKPYKLVIPSLIPVNEATGEVTFQACQAAINVVLNHVNSRTDILPDYQLEVASVNEGPGALLASRTFVNFLRKFEDEVATGSTSSFLSPIAMGPSVACYSVTHTLKLLKFTEFSQQCNGPYIVNRKSIYTNLYRFLLPNQYTLIAALLFQMQIGGWRQIAILTFSGNPSDPMKSQILQSMASANGIDVLYYGLDDGSVGPETIALLKNSGARVITMITAEINMGIALLCHGWENGLRAPQYVFILEFAAFLPPDSPSLKLPKGCTREMFDEQMAITFYFGLYRGTMQTSEPTTFGYDASWFTKQVNLQLNGTKANDDDNRPMCHDVVMATVLALNQSEVILRERYNASLKNFTSGKPGTNQELVQRIVNLTSTQLDFVGLRIGRIKYSSRLELDIDQMWVGQWDGRKHEVRMLYKAQRMDDGFDFRLSAYSLTKSLDPIWQTKTGRPPKDLSQVLHVTDSSPISAMAVVTAFGVFSIVVQIFQVFLIWWTRNKGTDPSDFSYFDLINKYLVLLGCLLLNLASILIVNSENALFSSLTSCNFELAFTAVGIASVDAVFLVQSFCFANVMKLPAKRIKNSSNTSKKTEATTNGRAKKESEPQAAPTYSCSMQRNVNWAVCCLLGASAVIVAVWLIGIDPVRIEKLPSVVAFDEAIDGYVETVSFICSSKYQIYWLAALLAIHGATLFASCFFSYQIGQLQLQGPILIGETRSLRLAIPNSTVIFIATLLVMLIFVSSDSQAKWVPHFVLAVGGAVFSLSTSLLVFLHCWQEGWKRIKSTDRE